MSTLEFSSRMEMEDYPCFPTGLWRVLVKDNEQELTFAGRDIRMTPHGLFFRHGNKTQNKQNRIISFVPWWNVEGCYQVETAEP